ncbi:hypothetical protein BGZ83_008017 [Gryganskiella cystojenkinii]|nr:hypothetical protein BGZ83_008017 [Gryganskiella cystojenkinii]
MELALVKKEAQESVAVSRDNNEESHNNKAIEKNGDGDDSEESDDDGDDVYEVERVVGHIVNQDTGLRSYLIKWKNYSINDNSWEPENSVFCHALVEDYWDRVEKRGGTSSDPYGQDPPPSPPPVATSPAITTATTAKSSSKRKAVSKIPKKGKSKAPPNESLLPNHDRISSPTTNKAIGVRQPPLDRARSATPIKRQRTESPSPTAATTTYSSVTPSSTKSKAAASPTTKTKETASSTKSSRTSDEEEQFRVPLHLASWESLVDEVTTVEQRGSTLVVHLLWNSGHRTEHTNMFIRKKCPDKLFNYYESKLLFTEVP